MPILLPMKRRKIGAPIVSHNLAILFSCVCNAVLMKLGGNAPENVFLSLKQVAMGVLDTLLALATRGITIVTSAITVGGTTTTLLCKYGMDLLLLIKVGRKKWTNKRGECASNKVLLLRFHWSKIILLPPSARSKNEK